MNYKKTMLIVLSLIVLFFTVGFVVLQHPKFGKIPKGERLERIKKSPHFRDGIFQNLHTTPQLTNESGFFSLLRDHISAKNKKPAGEIPSIKTDLKNLPANENSLVWFGHSSYFMQIDGKKFLVDPVFCGNASPFSFAIKAFNGTDRYTPEDIPEIDFLVITHDHWDHLDYKTIKAIRPKVKQIVTALGVGAHLEHWGFSPDSIVELDWFETASFGDVVFHATSARHFSGRGLRPKKTLWASFVLQTPSTQIFIGGDGGYDTHFAEIGERFGGFDLAILENGQYNTSWKYIHMMPEQVLQASENLRAKRLFPVHNSKFALANHAWDTPLKTIFELNKKRGIPLVTPLIGEKVNLNDSSQVFHNWWENVK